LISEARGVRGSTVIRSIATVSIWFWSANIFKENVWNTPMFSKKIILNKIIRTATSMLQEDTISESIYRSFVCIHTSQHVELKSRRWRIIIGWRKYSTAVHVTRRAESGYVKKFSFAGLIHKPLQARFAALCEHPRRIQQAPMIKWLAISLSVKRSSHTSKATCRNK
jgi:hypothetical protein